MQTDTTSDSDESKIECTYCGRDVTAPGSEESAPAVHDSAAWDRAAQEHELTCEWVATRAHRLRLGTGCDANGRPVVLGPWEPRDADGRPVEDE